MAVYRFSDASQLIKSTDIHSHHLFDHIIEVAKQGKYPGQLSNPKSVAIDSTTGEIYVVHTCCSHLIGISVFSKIGKFIEMFTSEFLWCPSGIAISKGNIYITESFANCVLQFTKSDRYDLEFKHENSNRNKKFSFPKKLDYERDNSERTIGKLHCPKQLAISSNGDIFIADCLNHQIQILGSNLNFKG